MGAITAGTILAYEVQEGQLKVHENLKKLGYRKRINFKNQHQLYALPGTAMCHDARTSVQALGDLKEVCTSLNIKIEKAVALKATDLVVL